MIIDIHVLLGESIFGYQLTPEQLLHQMNSAGIDMSVVSPVQPRSYHLEPENDYIAAMVAKYPEQLIGFARVDPRLEADAERELNRAIKQLGLKGLFLHPWEEGYRINDQPAINIARLAGELGIPVLVAAGYPWVSHALQVGELAGQCPETTIIMTNGGQINISGLAQADAFEALRDHQNLLIETSGLYRQDFIEEVIEEFGADRVLFGSAAPRMNQEFELARAKSATEKSSAVQQKVLGLNAARTL